MSSETQAVSSSQGVQPPPLKPLLVAVALGTILAPLNATLVAVALPEISASFGVSVGGVSWIVIGYIIVMAVMQPIGGRLGDLFGRRGIFMGSLAIFGLFSIGAALSPNLATIILMRAGQALTSAMALPNGAALIRQWAPENKRAAAFGIVGAAAGLAAGLGPPIGGVMIAIGGWRSMFWINIPIVIAAIGMAWRAFPREEPRTGPTSAFDIKGAMLFATILTALGLVATTAGDLNNGLLAGLIVIAVLGVVLFIALERRLAFPLIDLSIFKRRSFTGAAVTSGLSNVSLYSVLLAIPLFLSGVQGRGAAEVGFILSSMALPMVFLAPVAGRLADKWGRRRPAMLGGFFSLVGTAPLIAIGEGWGVLPIAACLATMGLGLSLLFPSTQTAALESVSAEDAGMASGVFSTTRFMGSMIGASLLAALLGGRGISADEVTAAKFMPIFIMIAVASGVSILTASLIRRK